MSYGQSLTGEPPAGWLSALPRAVAARLVHFARNGEYTAPPIALEGGIVVDEDHGWVLEIVLPMKGICEGECAVLIPIAELYRYPPSTLPPPK